MPTATRTFRVFLSSTFEDLIAERDALQTVFGKLAAVCEAHDTRFQAVDLRWGVRDEAALDHRTMDICLTEIERCRRTGIRPNFVILLGNRYGWCPVPASIDADEFARIHEQMDTDGQALVDTWYRCDRNAVPASFVLQRRSAAFVEADRWRPIEEALHRVLAAAADASGLPEYARAQYHLSATHQEILAGLTSDPEDRAHVFAFAREGPSHDARIDSLKNDLAATLKSNFVPFGDLAQLQDSLETRLTAIILSEVARLDEEPRRDAELRIHDGLASDLQRDFMGRVDVLDNIREYISGADPRPLVLSGPAGSGKSATMAHASQSTDCVRRFLGISPQTSNGAAVLAGLCGELDRRYATTGVVPTAFDDLAAGFVERLQMATAGRPIIIFIDALNQLHDVDPAAAGSWLPTRLPPHCRIVVSSLEVPPALRDARTLRLGEWAVDDASRALDAWLAASRRTLQDDQRTEVLSAFSDNGLPLYLWLAFEESRLWRSYDSPESCKLGRGLENITNQLFSRLSDETNHGHVMASCSLKYLSSSRYGLSEDEMLTTLSSDDTVRADFAARAHHPQPEGGLPTIIWSRLYFDLAPYLAEREINGTTVLTFRHQIVRETAAHAYLGTPDQRRDANARLAGIFRAAGDPESNGSWRGPLRALAELPVHLERADSPALAALLSSVRYLNARLNAGDLHDALSDYRRLPELDEICVALRDFVRIRRDRFTGKHDVLFGAILHEAPPPLRDAASREAGHTWPESWLESTPVWMPVVTAAAGAQSLSVLGKLSFGPRRGVGLARDLEMAFYLERLGRVRMVDLTLMRDVPQTVPVPAQRVLKLSASDDGRYLAVACEDGTLHVLELEFSGDRQLAASRSQPDTRYLIPEFSPPIIEWSAHEVIHQAESGDLLITSFPDATRRHIFHPPDTAELSSATPVNGSWVVTLRLGQDSLFWSAGTQAQHSLANADVLCAAAARDRVALALSDGTIRWYTAGTGIDASESIPSGGQPSSLAVWGDQLVWSRSDGLYSWDRDRLTTSRLADNEVIFGNKFGLHVRVLATTADGRLLAVSDSNVFVASRSDHSASRFRDVDTVLVDHLGGVFALQHQDEDLYLVDCGARRTTRLAPYDGSRHLAAIDSRRRLLVVSATGAGLMVDLATMEIERMNSPVAVNSIAVEGSHFWMIDRDGRIFRSTGSILPLGGEIEAVGDVTRYELMGPRLLMVGRWLIVIGVSGATSTHNLQGDRLYIVVFFERSTGSPFLTAAGFRTFDKSSGNLEAIIERSPDEMMLLFRRSAFEHHAVTATVDQLVSRNETAHRLDFADTIGGAVRNDGESLTYLLADDDLIGFDAVTFEERSRLTSVLPFTDIVRAGSGVIGIASRQRLYHVKETRPANPLR